MVYVQFYFLKLPSRLLWDAFEYDQQFDKIYNSSEQHYSPSSSATVSVYTLDNYAFNIAVETTEPNGVTWVTTGHDDDNLIIKNAKLYCYENYIFNEHKNYNEILEIKTKGYKNREIYSVRGGPQNDGTDYYTYEFNKERSIS